MSSGAADTGVRFLEAIDYLRWQLGLGPDEWAELLRAVDALAADRAERFEDALRRDILAALAAALEDGGGEAAFLDEWDEIIERHGWLGGDGRGAFAWRNIVAEAYAAGRWQQIQALKHIRPWLRYVHVDPGLEQAHSRPHHAAWHGVVLHVDDPWWDTHFPPNGWYCRCYVMSLSERDLKRYGYTVSPAAPAGGIDIKFVAGRPVEVPAGIDPGFAFNPGKVWGA